jgi:hypothetical protein
MQQRGLDSVAWGLECVASGQALTGTCVVTHLTGVRCSHSVAVVIAGGRLSGDQAATAHCVAAELPRVCIDARAIGGAHSDSFIRQFRRPYARHAVTEPLGVFRFTRGDSNEEHDPAHGSGLPRALDDRDACQRACQPGPSGRHLRRRPTAHLTRQMKGRAVMLTPAAGPDLEQRATSAQCTDWRELQLEVINAAAEYIACGGRGIALFAATAILTDAYAIRSRSTLWGSRT